MEDVTSSPASHVSLSVCCTAWRLGLVSASSYTWRWFSTASPGQRLSIFHLTFEEKIVQVDIRIESIPGSDTEFLRVTPDIGILFPAVSGVRRLITRSCEGHSGLVVVVDCLHLNTIDYTAAAQVNTIFVCVLSWLCQLVRSIV